VGEESEEVRAALPLDTVLLEEAGEGLVDDGGGFEGVAGALMPEETPSELPEFLVHERHGAIGRLAIAEAPALEQLRKSFAGRDVHPGAAAQW
jgi:hypothetical protein